jgi:hypothetical protein
MCASLRKPDQRVAATISQLHPITSTADLRIFHKTTYVTPLATLEAARILSGYLLASVINPTMEDTTLDVIAAKAVPFE